MNYLPISQLPLIELEDATGEVSEIFDDIQHEMDIPFIPNIFKTAASSSRALIGSWGLMQNVYLQSSLPMTLKAMILYSISTAHQCKYCSAVHEVTCQNLDVSEETLEALAQDHDRLTPVRVREIVKFAVRCADDATNLTEADYEHIRHQGISDEELIEIIALAALGNYFDTLADAMKIDVDSIYVEALNEK